MIVDKATITDIHARRIEVSRRAESVRVLLRDAAGRYAGVAIGLGASADDAVEELTTSFNRMVKEYRRKS